MSWLRALKESLIGPTCPTAPIKRRGIRLGAEELENRLVPAGPTTFTVTTFLDNNVAHPGLTSLRDAINAANTNGNPTFTDVILFAPGLAGKTINIAPGLGELHVTQSVNIAGMGAGLLAIDGGGVGGVGGTRIFEVSGGEGSPVNVTFRNLTLKNGNFFFGGEGSEENGGGAIEFLGSTPSDSLTVQSCVLKSNVTDSTGGALHLAGSGKLTVRDSTFLANLAGNEGGAICFHSGGDLLIERSTFTGNQSSFHRSSVELEQGGAISIEGSGATKATINASTFNANVAGGEGGAIAVRGSSLLIQNSTIYGNTSSGDGGGIWNAFAKLTLRNDTITKNTSTDGEGGGVYNEGGTVNVYNSIIDSNKDFNGSALVANDISSGSSSDFTWNVLYSLIQTVPPGTINGLNAQNIFNVSAGLGPLQLNGGPTMTCAITISSPAFRRGNVALAVGLTTDQRGIGFARIVAGFVDMGAYQIQLSALRRRW